MFKQCMKFLVVSSLAIGLLSSCSSVVRKNAPTISHIHIGHAITGWPLTPKKQGLLVVAELASISVATKSELLLTAARNDDLIKAKRFLNEIALEVDPGSIDPDRANEYGLRRAAAESITHLKLASETSDASSNVQRTVTQTTIRAGQIVDRVDELTAFLDAGLISDSVDELEIIAEEIVRSLKAIAGGPENNTGYGLYEFREDIEAMVSREVPAYQTVESFYLFNLVKLPDGQWGFASRRSRGAAGAGY